MKMMPHDLISHENQLQRLSEPSIFMLDVFQTADHAGQIFIPHRLKQWSCPSILVAGHNETNLFVVGAKRNTAVSFCPTYGAISETHHAKKWHK